MNTQPMNPRQTAVRVMKGMLCAAHILLALYLFLQRPCGLDPAMSRLMLVLTVPADLAVFRPVYPKVLKRFLKPLTLLFSLLIAVYAAFAFFGTDIFMLEEPELVADEENFCTLLHVGLWFWPVILGALYGLGILCAPRHAPRPHRLKRHQSRAILFACLLATQLLAAAVWSPGYYTTDATSVLEQAAGNSPLSDWHPFLNAVLAMPLVAVCYKAWFITAVQMAVPAFVLTGYLMALWDMGVGAGLLSAGGVLFLLLPNQLMSDLTVQKDTLFTWALLWITLQLLRMLQKPERVSTPGWLAGTVISLFLIFGLRHNGVVPAAVICLLLVILGIVRLIRKAPRRMGAWLLTAGLLPAALFGVWKGPVMSLLNVQPNGQSSYIPILDAVGAIYANYGVLDEEYEPWLEEVQPLEDWATYYSRYTGHDSYLWAVGKSSGFDTSSVTLERALTLLKVSLEEYPDYVIHDRLDGCNIVWDVTMPSGSFNNRWIDYVYGSEGNDFAETPFGQSAAAKAIRDFYNTYILQPSTDELLDPILWRSGIYLVLMLTLMLYWCATRQAALLIPAAPAISHIIFSMCVIYHQTFRYVWAIQILTVAMLAVTVALGRHPAPALSGWYHSTSRQRSNHEQQLSED